MNKEIRNRIKSLHFYIIEINKQIEKDLSIISDVWEEYEREWGMVRHERKERKEGQNLLHSKYCTNSNRHVFNHLTLNP